MDVFGVSKKDMVDAMKIKIFDGIAGSGKSTKVVNFLKKYGFKYYTPTNRLTKSAMDRFDIKAETVASGLFKTVGGRFYAAERPMEGENVIIDELLLTDPAIWDYITHNQNNYFLLTDSCQMLPPRCNTIKIAQERLKDFEYIYKRIAETKRATTEKTQKMYSYFYALARKETTFPVPDLLRIFPVINFEELQYRPECTYIVHTNREEKRLYQRHRKDIIERMPKALAAKETDGEKIHALPMMCQTDAITTRAKSYSQAMNISTPTRFQGCETGGELYYIISLKSAITTRELYTVITRVKDIDKLVIVLDDEPQDDFKTFMGKRVKKEAFITLPDDKTVCDTGKAAQFLAQLKNKKSDEYHYSEDAFFIDGQKGMYRREDIIDQPKKMHKPSEVTLREKEDVGRRMTCKSLLAKEDGVCLGAEAVKEVYRILEKHGVDKIKRPTLENFGSKKEHTHNFDFYSAFPHLLYYGDYPIEGEIYHIYDPEHMNFYYNTKNNLVTGGSIVTEDVVKRMGEKAQKDFIFLFGTEYKTGTTMGKKLLEKSLRSIDSKKAVKQVHWGFLLTPFMRTEREAGKDIYVINEAAMYELFGIALYSHIITAMLDIIKTGKITSFHTVIDGIFYEGDDETDAAIIDYIKKSPYRGRLYHGHFEKTEYIKDCIQWKNYEELTTRRKKVTL